MNLACTIKQKNGDKWELVPLSAVAGKTLEQILNDCDGKEIVAEFVIGGKRFYFCGTPHWLERMNRKGKAVGFQQAIEILRQRRPELLREEIPGLRDISDVFPGPGTVLESFNVGE